ncbi:UvrD-helicase domain-containing protein [Amycolatopsis jiangsuensis]|uniref:DNA helicase-2/ATP-dependent DNA helicase PcrA n=1 Tax=Amycolatopsis jiangsuensis TaxID=1181879 RepID=A0A840IST6_9PSEU|nr:ATP-dependent helicase [Amycolatopsis jiangsuensis]MBB4684437.1 DNA helicase-2/ATP-dependent DNA helicase PcrA [Amycolatopsis jiangsuensis]
MTTTPLLADPRPAIATSELANLLVVAPPGCGKTEVLAQRAAFLMGRLKPGQRILVLTFSNKARQNLRERLVRELGPAQCRRYVTVRNFHGHAAEVLRAHARTIGLAPDFSQPCRQTLKTAIKPHAAKLPPGDAVAITREIEEALSAAKQQPLDDHEVLVALANAGNGKALDIERSRQNTGQLHYDDLLRHAQRLLRIQAVANLYQQHYGALLVDEFQDLTPQQLDIALRTVSSYRTFVGDPLQGIYTFAGARPDLVEAELRQLCGEPMRLTTSYRSSPAVLAVVNPVAESMGSPPLTSANSEQWFEGGASTAIRFTTENAETEWIVDTARSILARDPAATIGVIARSSFRRENVDTAFTDADVPSTQWDLAVQNPQIMETLRIAAKGLAASASLDKLKDRALTGVPAADVDTHQEIADAISQLKGSASQAGTIGEAFTRLPERDPSAAIGPGVHLLSAHTGKGQQFDWVFVPGFERGHIPDCLAWIRRQGAAYLRPSCVRVSGHSVPGHDGLRAVSARAVRGH